MKKLVFLICILSIFVLIGWNHSGQAEIKDAYQIIPDDAIRLRILANSDNEEDQQLKYQVRDAVNEKVTEWVAEIEDIEEARKLIQEKLPEIEEIIHKIVEENETENQFTVDYDSNITFPTKLYGDYLYPAGEYEAILITLGKGKGTNWWCVLFPPLCFLDFSFGTTVEAKDTYEVEQEEPEASEETEVKFFLFEWLGWS